MCQYHTQAQHTYTYTRVGNRCSRTPRMFAYKKKKPFENSSQLLSSTAHSSHLRSSTVVCKCCYWLTALLRKSHSNQSQHIYTIWIHIGHTASIIQKHNSTHGWYRFDNQIDSLLYRISESEVTEICIYISNNTQKRKLNRPRIVCQSSVMHQHPACVVSIDRTDQILPMNNVCRYVCIPTQWSRGPWMNQLNLRDRFLSPSRTKLLDANTHLAYTYLLLGDRLIRCTKNAGIAAAAAATATAFDVGPV